jgi:inhibitor of KinA sporulation pathway (predicted exonuclease)
MARTLDRILVIDVESTCWEGTPPPGQMSEIIEIGLATVDVARLERVDRRSILVRPACSAVSAYCTQLTTLTQADVNAGIPLAEACRLLAQEYRAAERPWASYGDYDRQQFERNCVAFGIPYPFGPTHLNVKNLAAMSYGWSREVGLSEGLRRIGLPLEGIHHRGGDDAWNIAGLVCQLLRRMRGKP